jgi:CheY-like chemotaxis protein
VSPSEYSIIAVEDEPSELLLLKRALQTGGLENPLQVFRAGQEVIDYLSQQGARVVIPVLR